MDGPSHGISGVRVSPLKQFPDDRGSVMHMLRCTDPYFVSFGEIYFSCVRPGAVKAWRKHTRMTLNYAVPHGRIKLVIYDDREDSPSRGRIQQLCLGPDNYHLVTIPPLLWSGFQGLGDHASIVANCASIPHDPNEAVRIDPSDSRIPYDWYAAY